MRFPTCQFYRSKSGITRTSNFRKFCKLLRNVVTETFAEPAANWEVSSNRILTGRPSGSFINVKLVIHYLMLLIFRQFCKPLRNFVTKTFQLCSQRVPMMGFCKGFWLFWLMTLLLTRLTLWLLSEKFLWKVWLSWATYVKFGLFWLSRLKFWNDTFCGIWLLWQIFWQNFLDLPPFWTPW